MPLLPQPLSTGLRSRGSVLIPFLRGPFKIPFHFTHPPPAPTRRRRSFWRCRCYRSRPPILKEEMKRHFSQGIDAFPFCVDSLNFVKYSDIVFFSSYCADASADGRVRHGPYISLSFRKNELKVYPTLSDTSRPHFPRFGEQTRPLTILSLRHVYSEIL